MSEIDDFLLSGNDQVDGSLGTKMMSCDGQTFQVVWNEVRKSYEGALGGLESSIQATAVAQPGSVTNPAGLLKKKCMIDGDSFRIAEVSVGNIAVGFTLTSTSESR
jgi:hypothetical protein